VILRGKAESEAQKELTTEYVKDVEGVKEVRNEMTSPASTKATKASKKTHDDLREMIDDASITAQVKYALLSHRSTSALNTNQDGPRGRHVERQGKNAAEKDLAAKFAKDVNGVKSVKNQMTIEASK